MKQEKFNYVIGFYWPGTDQIAEYTFGGSVSYSTMKEAKKYLKEVQAQNSENEYKIFKLMEVY